MGFLSKGRLVLLDIVGWQDDQDFSAEDLLQSMRAVAEAAGIRIVHEHLVHFDGSVSPKGFAAILLIDESHISAHCYSEQGLLAMDIFTCGEHDPDTIADNMLAVMFSAAPTLECVNRQSHSRFLDRE